MSRFVTLLSICVSLFAQGSDRGAIVGYVVEVDHKGKEIGRLRDVLVTAFFNDTVQKEAAAHVNPRNPYYQVRTNENGDFTFPSLELGQWNFAASRRDYHTFTTETSRHNVISGQQLRSVDPKPIPLHRTSSSPVQSIPRSRLAQGFIVLAMYRASADAQDAAEDYQIDVQVLNPLGRPLSGAFVRVLEYSTQGTLVDTVHGSTDASGAYHSGALSKDGRGEGYVLTVAKYGYASAVLERGWVPRTTTRVVLDRPLEVSESTGIETIEASHRKVFTGATGRTMEALPLSGMRSFDELALLAPGVAPPPETLDHTGPSYAPGIGTAGSFVANGLRGRGNSFELDGGDDNDELVGIRRQGFLVSTSQAIESIQEFQVISALPDARFGRSLGGQVSVTTKPSVGGFHGNAYGFFTDRALSARNFFEGATANLPAKYPVTGSSGVPVLLDGQPLSVNNPSVTPAPFSRLQAGGVTGFNFHDTYVFLAGEREVQKGREETSFAVPSVEQRGMFNSGASGMFVNGAPSLPNTIPGDAVFSLYPFPNNPLGPYSRNTYTAQLPNEGNGMRSSIKLDHKVQDLFVVGLRGSYMRDRSVRGSTDGAIDSAVHPNIRNYGFGMLLVGSGKSQNHSFRLSGSGTVASFEPYLRQALYPNAPLLLNVTQPSTDVGGRTQARYVSVQSATGAQILSSFGFPNNVIDTSGVLGPVGQLAIAGFSSVGLDTVSYTQHRNDVTIQFAYNGTVARRGSIYSFGAEVRPRREYVHNLGDYRRPLITFSGLHNTGLLNGVAVSTPSSAGSLTNLAPTTLAAAGIPSGVLQTLIDIRPEFGGFTGPVPSHAALLNQGNFYFQNERQIRPFLRVTAGLRIELNSAQDQSFVTFQNAFNRKQLLVDAQEAENDCGARCNGLLSSVAQAFPIDFLRFTPGNRFGVGPRLGFAWLPLPGKNWSVRGGFGFYTGQLQFFAANDARQAFNTSVPLNFANFPIVSNQGSYLFNLGNPTVRQLSPGLNVIQAPYYNTLTENPFLLLTQGLFNVQDLGLQPTLTSLTLVEPVIAFVTLTQ